MDSEHPLVIFDGICNLCEYSVQFIIRNDRRARFKFASAQSEKGVELQRLYGVDTLKQASVILIKDSQVYIRSDAALEIARDLDWPWRYLYVFRFLPKSIRDYGYSTISKYRYRWFGKKPTCFLPDDRIKQRFL